MNKISLILKREYISRVRKKSFIIMTLLAPILMAALVIVPVLVMSINEDDNDKTIAVIDKTHKFKGFIKDKKKLKFEFVENKTIDELKSTLKDSEYNSVLFIPDSIGEERVQIFSYKQTNMEIKRHISSEIEKKLESEKFKELGINEADIKKAKSSISIRTIKLTDDGKEKQSSTEMIMVIGYIGAILIYMFIFIYGAQVMRGVIEEKTSRIIEIMISSVKPFQLMMGKILGIALVALTQVVFWVIFTSLILIASQSLIGDKTMAYNEKNMTNIMPENEMKDLKLDNKTQMIDDIFSSVNDLPYATMLFAFLFYFIGGYLLYASLFAAIGSAVDNEADTQQFMLPITIPLILAFVLAQPILENPDGQIAFWFSIIPFTSPIIMMIRIMFDVPLWELLLSMFLLIITFIGTTWLAAKIYRTGILMYGKKVSYKELWKWIKYND